MLGFIAFVCLVASSSAARFASYFDAECSVPVTKALAFTDVCTWSSNRYTGSYALHLTECSAMTIEVAAYNLTGQAGCMGPPIDSISLNSSCVFYQDSYIKVLDFTCNSQNNTYNINSHFTPNCEDGGYAFSIQLGDPTCQEDSFGPGLWDWDARGNYSDPYYMLELFNSTDDRCQNEIAVFQTKQFPAWCLPTVQPFQNISIDIYPAFSMN